jgi:putative endopeptidase
MMKSMIKIILSAIVVLAIALSCTNINSKDKQNLADPLITNCDTTISPGTDFFHYANGGWFKRNPIPATESYNGLFQLVQDTINVQVNRICNLASTDLNAAKNSNKQKIGDLYASGLDTLNIDKVGILPLREAMQKIDSITDVKSLMLVIAQLHSIGVAPAYNFYVGQDDKISTKYALFFFQGGLGLGQRDYYFNTDSRTLTIRKEYVKHLENMFQLIGVEEASSVTNAKVIMSIETDLARASRKLEALRDPVKNYNKMSVEQFDRSAPNISWKEILPVLGVANADTVIICQPEFYQTLDKLLTSYTINDWKTYVRWNLINTYAEYLNKEIEQQNFNFYYTTLSGITEQKPRWKRVVETTNGYLGELIGQVYIEEYLPQNTKEKLLEIGNSIRNVYAERIKKLDWMSEPTKEKALVKLNKMVMKVGYPDKWKDMSNLTIDRSSYCANIMHGNEWFHNYMVSKYGKPVDRLEWNMYPQTYNAYYSPSNNEIVIPACNIIVPGFEGRMPDDAILYAIIGATFGHEIIHGFDDQGCKYDDRGNLNNWWTDEDQQRFIAKTKLIVDQYNGYTVLDSLHINGDATQGENIADLAGVTLAYEAFKKTPQYEENITISGLTPDKRFFLSYAYAWMVNVTNESLARQIMMDVHSPAEFRVNGPLSNIPEFYRAFNIKEGEPMFRPDSLRIVIW